MANLRGKTALVTGGSSGIGFATAQGLAQAGARVAIVGRREAQLRDAAARLGHDVTALAADVTRGADLDKLFEAVKTTFGALDILVCSAGTTTATPLGHCTEKDFDAIFDVNVKSIFFTVQTAAPLLNTPSSVIVVGSVCDTITIPGSSVYAASKAALHGFVRCWAAELAPRGVRVNGLSPGLTETPLLARLQERPEVMAHFDAMVATRTNLKRRGRAEEVAAVATFLASEDSSYMTGGFLYADGGMHGW